MEKKLSLSKYALKKFHKNFKEFWFKIGYNLKSKHRNQKLPHLGKTIKQIPQSIIRKPTILFKLNEKKCSSTRKMFSDFSDKYIYSVYCVVKLNSTYIITHNIHNNLQKLLNNLLTKAQNSPNISDIWILCDQEKFNILIFLKLNTKKGGEGKWKQARS